MAECKKKIEVISVTLAKKPNGIVYGDVVKIVDNSINVNLIRGLSFQEKETILKDKFFVKYATENKKNGGFVYLSRSESGPLFEHRNIPGFPFSVSITGIQKC